uniref:SFRICE_030162 n=1 Tax=Spodoptera frugiperda TaxID=7108 RepID=A0A2H1VYJ3_SPOFR
MSTTHSNIGGEFVLTSPALGGARGSCRILLLKEGKQPPRAANVAGPAANVAVGRSLPGAVNPRGQPGSRPQAVEEHRGGFSRASVNPLDIPQFRVGTTLLGPSVVGSLGLILAGQQAMVAGDGQAITEARSVSRRLERIYTDIFQMEASRITIKLW